MSQVIINDGKLAFETDALFKEVVWTEPDCWYFIFENEISVRVEGGLWRLLHNNRIQNVSADHMQQFGLPEPIDLVKEITNKLLTTHLLRIEVKEDTGDLKLSLSNDYALEVFITSSGYESYSFSINDKEYIGMGAGEISCIDKPVQS